MLFTAAKNNCRYCEDVWLAAGLKLGSQGCAGWGAYHEFCDERRAVTGATLGQRGAMMSAAAITEAATFVGPRACGWAARWQLVRSCGAREDWCGAALAAEGALGIGRVARNARQFIECVLKGYVGPNVPENRGVWASIGRSFVRKPVSLRRFTEHCVLVIYQ